LASTITLFRQARDQLAFRPGEIIFAQGQPGDLMYVVISGAVDIVVNDIVIHTVREDGIFGEMALIDKGPRFASAVAHSHCTVATVTERQFEFMVQQTPFFALQVMRIMAERLRERPISASG
jgi:CRP/FNR family cyclic AMP-dependent transcriptional regulator